MNDKLESDSMIVALTDGIGAPLGRALRSSFHELNRRLSKVTLFAKSDPEVQDQLIDLLALSIFYTEIISPLKSSTSFVALVRKSEATHVRIGPDKLDSQFAMNAGHCVSRFMEILQTNSIPVRLLSFPSLAKFVNNVVRELKERSNETLDKQSDTNETGEEFR